MLFRSNEWKIFFTNTTTTRVKTVKGAQTQANIYWKEEKIKKSKIKQQKISRFFVCLFVCLFLWPWDFYIYYPPQNSANCMTACTGQPFPAQPKPLHSRCLSMIKTLPIKEITLKLTTEESPEVPLGFKQARCLEGFILALVQVNWSLISNWSVSDLGSNPHSSMS